jgi:hypothetical protein
MTRDRLLQTGFHGPVERQLPAHGTPGKQTLTQMLPAPGGDRPGQGEAVHRVATAGVAGAHAPLPHGPTIQQLFGRHDVSHVRTAIGGAGRIAAEQIGARAYATGDRIAFSETPDLHTAAHEAAHVVQQRADVSLAGGVGQAGDSYEQHADRVADLVVAGKSAEAALDQMAGRGTSAIQCQYDLDPSAAQRPAGAAAGPEPGFAPPAGLTGSIDITEVLFVERERGSSAPSNSEAAVQQVPDPSPGQQIQRQPTTGEGGCVQRQALVQRQADIPPPPPAYPSVYEWFFDVSDAMGEAWNMTCQDGRERGFYVLWNEASNKSAPGPVVVGEPAKGCAAAHLSLGPVPADRKPVYPVGFFHTHPLAPPGCHKIGVGPSDVDKQTASDNHLPGAVRDTSTTSSGARDSGTFFFGVTRRQQ